MVESVCALSQTCEAAVEFREIHALLIKRRRVTRNSQFAQVEAEREALTLFKVCTRGRTGSESARVTGPATSYTSWISLVIEGRIVGSLSTRGRSWTVQGAKLPSSILTREIICWIIREPSPPETSGRVSIPLCTEASRFARELRYRRAVINRGFQSAGIYLSLDFRKKSNRRSWYY